MKTKKYKLEDFAGAIAVLDNYLDGAVADYEDGDGGNGIYACVWGCINALKLIYLSTEPLVMLGGIEYEERMNKAKEKRNDQTR